MPKQLKNPKVIGVDFDGTVAGMFRFGRYIPKTRITYDPITAVISELRTYREKGFRIIIDTSRWWGEYNWVKDWLDRHGVPYDDIVMGRFKADVYLCDRTVNPTLPGWKKALAKISKHPAGRRK